MLEDGEETDVAAVPVFKMALISFLVNSVPTRELREGRRMLLSSMLGLLSWAIEVICRLVQLGITRVVKARKEK